MFEIQSLGPDNTILGLEQPKKILFADDAADLREAIGIFLLEEGYEIQAAGDGAEAISLFAEFQPDLVILDLNMPVVSGSEACAIIRQHSDVPIIIFTAVDGANGSKELIEKGATEIVLKSSGMVELTDKVAFHLDNKNGRILDFNRNSLETALV